MSGFYYDEFSVSIRWRQPERGSYPRPDVPGFYLTAGWANEGAANYPIEEYRLNDSDFQAIMEALDTVTGCAGTFAAATRTTVRQAENAIEKRKQMLRERIAAAQSQLSELEHP